MEATIRYTLLEMVQILLSAMDSDEVTSINDTVESYQLAVLIRSAFYDLATELELDEHEGLFQLTASGDNALPCLMTLPTNVATLRELSYDIRDSGDTYADWKELTYMPLDQFLEMQNTLKDQTSNIVEMAVTSNSETHKVLCWSDRDPTYYTSFDSTTLLFDSYDSTVDTTLQKSKTQCYGALYTTFTLSDAFAPDLDPSQFSYFMNKVKVRAFYELKQQENAEAAAEASRQKVNLQRRRRRIPDLTEFDKLPKYGRK